MTRKLQLLLTTLLLTIVGVTGAWAQTNISPTSDMFFRTSLSNSTYSWSSGYPKDNGKGIGTNSDEMAGNHRVGMFVLQKYEVADLAAANSIVLHLHRVSGGDAIAVWAFSTNDWSKSSTASTMASAVNTIVGLDLNTTGTPSKTPLVNGGTNVDDSQFAISGDALTTLKNAATYSGATGTFTLLLTNRTADMNNGSSGDRKFYGSSTSTEANRPYIAVTYDVAEVGSTRYTTLESAVTAAEEGSTIKILKDCKLTSRVVFNKNLTIEPNRADITVTIDGDVTGDYYALGLATASKTITIGSSTYSMAIDGNKKTYGDRKLLEVTNGQVNLLNLTIKDAYTSTAQGIVCAKSSGKVQLTDITFDGCQSTNATTPCIVFNGANDQIILSGNNTFTDCTADLSGTYTNCNIYLERRVKIDAGISNTTPIRLYAKESNIGLGNPVATQSLPADEARFFILNDNYACYSKSNGSSRADLTICEGKTLDVTAAEAATLVLPFAATIPEGVTCYTLTHTDGASTVTATEVTGGTLAAETPVLVNATMGSYKFRNSSKATTATSIPDSPSVSEALTGVYSDLTFTTENIASIYANAYILNKIDDSVGFYKAADGKKVGANRAYLTATNVPGTGEARSLSIVFDDGETTGVTDVRSKMEEVKDDYFDLSGRRVAHPTKGLYIMNGKKIIIK
ncbi:MAG: hypothetical protein IJS06_06030 [Prevotella sp.]|nr:hypothetical protein [Prevotella sp.]